MTICDIDHLHKRFLDIWEWCMQQGFDTRAFTYVENAFKSEPTAEVADHKTELQIDCQDGKYVWCGIKTENSSEKPNNCEPQTIRCPKCGRTDYIRDMEKDMGIKGSHYKYKCINCNTYIKDEP